DILLNYGQGIITFLIFGLDISVLLEKIRSILFTSLTYNSYQLRIPREIDATTKQVCDQFVCFHKQNCMRDMLKERNRVDPTSDSFKGRHLIDWLIAAGIANDRKQAETYGRHLVLGGVLEHIKGCQHFHDCS